MRKKDRYLRCFLLWESQQNVKASIWRFLATEKKAAGAAATATTTTTRYKQQGTNNKVQTITGTPSSSYISFCVYPLGYKQKLGPLRCYLAGVRSPTICISICIWRCIHLSNQIKPNQIKSNLSIYSIYLSSCMFLYIGRDLTQQLFSLSQWLGDVGSPTSPIGFTGVTISTHSPTSR